MDRIKALFLDIDGTLLSHRSKQIPPSAVRALCKLQEEGILLIAATGRHYVDLGGLPISQIGFDYHVTLNGQLIFDKNGKLLVGRPFSVDATRAVKKLFDEKKVAVMPVTEGGNLINFIDAKVRYAFEAISTKLPLVGSYDGETIYQAMIYSSKEYMEKAAGEIPDTYPVRWNEFAIDILPKGGGKEHGVSDMMDILDLGKDEIIAFGDGENDIGMLSLATRSVAMGNADEDVKKAASYVTTDIDDGGIENALKYFGLI